MFCGSFLDISQAFDRVWHEGLLYKVKVKLPIFYSLLKSYLKNRHFLIKYEDAITGLYPVRAGVPQGSVLEPLLYLIYIADLPVNNATITGTFADDTAILTSHKDPSTASSMLQESLDALSTWLKNWRIKANEIKSVHVTFTLRQGNCPYITLNNYSQHRNSSGKPREISRSVSGQTSNISSQKESNSVCNYGKCIGCWA